MNILVLRALGLGDLLTAVPALRAIRRAYPLARITLAAPEWLRELVTEIDVVDDLLPTEDLVSLDWSGPPPDVAVNLHGRGPRSTALLRALRPRRLLVCPVWEEDQHEVARWCRMLTQHGITADRDDLTLPTPAWPSPAPGTAVVHPGASHAARRWPPERYADVIRWLGANVVVTGSPSERTLAERVARLGGLSPSRVLAGRTGLGELAALVAHASLVICGDTGTAHLATAYGTRSVVLFGPVSPRHWGPPPERTQHRALWAGQTSDTFAAHPAPGLLRISADEVIGVVTKGGEHACA